MRYVILEYQQVSNSTIIPVDNMLISVGAENEAEKGTRS